jgi:hypothetical protein
MVARPCLIFRLEPSEKLETLVGAKATVEQTLDGGAPEKFCGMALTD